MAAPIREVAKCWASPRLFRLFLQAKYRPESFLPDRAAPRRCAKHRMRFAAYAADLQQNATCANVVTACLVR
jgi:hypothetical protein